MLKVQEFIRNHNDWEQLLSQSPYCLKVSRDTIFGKDLIGLKYNQIDSDFSNEIVRECRGLILSESDNYEVVSVPFFKFGNYGESYADKIDWQSAIVQEKIDGSIMKVVRVGDELLISTNGTINAFKAEISSMFNVSYKSFGELFMNCEPINQFSKQQLLEMFEEGYTYIFEMVSPYTKVIIDYGVSKVFFIGCRDNQSLQEILIYNHPLSKVFDTPKRYPLQSLDDCIKATSIMGSDEEGFVVVDKSFKRVKIKSPAYVLLHHMRGEGILTKKRSLDIIKNGELSEFCGYFPDWKEPLEHIASLYQSLINAIENDWKEHSEKIDALENRKDRALYVQSHCKYMAYAFARLSGKVLDAKQYVDNLHPDKVLVMIENMG